MSSYEDWIEKTGGCAFPFKIGPEEEPGLTKREWFAGQALAGLMWISRDATVDADHLAQIAFDTADAMLKAEDS